METIRLHILEKEGNYRVVKQIGEQSDLPSERGRVVYIDGIEIKSDLINKGEIIEKLRKKAKNGLVERKFRMFVILTSILMTS